MAQAAQIEAVMGRILAHFWGSVASPKADMCRSGGCGSVLSVGTGRQVCLHLSCWERACESVRAGYTQQLPLFKGTIDVIDNLPADGLGLAVRLVGKRSSPVGGDEMSGIYLVLRGRRR